MLLVVKEYKEKEHDTKVRKYPREISLVFRSLSSRNFLFIKYVAVITYLWFLKIVWNYTFLSTEEITKLEKSLTKKFSLMHVPLVIGRSVDNFISAD